MFDTHKKILMYSVIKGKSIMICPPVSLSLSLSLSLPLPLSLSLSLSLSICMIWLLKCRYRFTLNWLPQVSLLNDLTM